MPAAGLLSGKVVYKKLNYNEPTRLQIVKFSDTSYQRKTPAVILGKVT
jgi:hypothetical protein